MHSRILALTFFALVGPALATSMDEAVALFKNRKYPEARAAFEAVAAAEAKNAQACSYLAQTIVRMGGSPKALDEALPWMEKAAALAPDDAHILSIYGQLCMEVAALHTSIPTARKGREALDAALVLRPDDLDAREALFQYYAQAPWPIGSSAKAAAQLEEITRRDPYRGAVLSINARIREKDYAAAFKLCDGLLAKKPDDATALSLYGRVAATSGQNLKQGLTCMQKCLALGPTAPGAPRPAGIWVRIGSLQEKMGDAAAARTAYETALQLDPKSKAAAAALAALK